jgi:type I restriction enzyme S subunit
MSKVELKDVVLFNPENVGKKFEFDEIYYLDISSVGEGIVGFDNPISLAGAPSRAKRLVRQNDIIMSTVRPGNRSFSFVRNFPENTVVSTGFAVLRVANERIDPRYLYYTISNNEFTAFLVANEQGANYPAVTPEVIGRAEIFLPPLPIQHRIASILSAYDDLIENNLKRIKLLEELAQRTYEEWFVKFRINGKQLPMDNKTGLPVGWERKKITDCYSFKQYKEKVKKFDGDIVYLATADVDGSQITGTGEVVNWENKPSRAQIKLIKESVWFARMSNTHKVILTTSNFKKEFIISSGFAGFIAKNSNCLPFLFCLINSKEFHDKKDMFATGATQVSLNDISLSSIEIVEPTIIIIEEFGKSFLNNLELRQNLIDQNQSLKNSRDILLPKLMSGKINVA